MNQYERIVSYIYQYNGEEKGANVGYAKVEKRGNQCRISVQMRAVSMREVPKVYLYKQGKEKIYTIPAGQMVFRGSNFLWKDSCEADKLFGTEWQIEEVDGIFIDGADVIYFATSWRKDYFRRGAWNKNSTVVDDTIVEQKEILPEENQAESEEIQEKLEEDAVPIIEPPEYLEEVTVAAENAVQEEAQQIEMPENIAMETEQPSEDVSEENTVQQEVKRDEIPEDNHNGQDKQGAMQTLEEQRRDLQMQSICGVCPFKRKSFDYGKKILMTFPSMKPFDNGVARACVRMELQDIGCLPIASWSLSGNRFLLHGYYCYRHLLFAQLVNGKYVLGVPGIYSEKERRNAIKFGFSDFQSIGDFGMQQGVFGYWFLELPEGNPVPLS